MKTLFSILDKRSPKYIWRLALFIVVLLGIVSYFLNTSLPLELFYIFPILITSWYGSKKSGILLSLTATFVLFLVQLWHQTFVPVQLFTYVLFCVVSFSALAILVTNFRNVHRIESTAADTDSLTGISNSRGFYVELANELLRSSRYNHCFSLAYLDVDDFKRVNDTLGHAEGDRLLIEVASCLKRSLRSTDMIARIGGDEFACLFPETDQKEAIEVFSKIDEQLKLGMARKNWPVGFSVGLVTFDHLPQDVKEAMKAADDLMYTVKNSEKNSVAYRVWPGETQNLR